MTTTYATDVPVVRLDFDTGAPTFSKAIAHLDHAATKELDRVDFDHRLRELLRLRVSQLNGCAYCVDMHTQTARAVGETDQRLAAIPVWRETGFFTDAERAALAFARPWCAWPTATSRRASSTPSPSTTPRPRSPL
jgi:AhpD family alkylhydroperoxidase